MENNNFSAAIISILGALVSLIGALVMIYKAKPERKKLEADGNASIADAAESLVSGAKISNELLLKRIQELEQREYRRDQDWQKRFDEMATELDAFKDWARRLVHQLKSHNIEPVPFKPGKEARTG